MGKINSLYRSIITTLNLATPWSHKLWLKAESLFDFDASPKDTVPDELACAESVSNIIISCGINFPFMVSTIAMDNFLSKSINWVEVTKPLQGDIIISPTGQGGKNGITNGHVGIMSTNNIILSNYSPTGKFIKFYNLNTWTERYTTRGGYPIKFYRILTNI